MKTKWNRAIELSLKNLLERNQGTKILSKLNSIAATNYSTESHQEIKMPADTIAVYEEARRELGQKWREKSRNIRYTRFLSLTRMRSF